MRLHSLLGLGKMPGLEQRPRFAQFIGGPGQRRRPELSFRGQFTLPLGDQRAQLLPALSLRP